MNISWSVISYVFRKFVIIEIFEIGIIGLLLILGIFRKLGRFFLQFGILLL